VSDAEAVNACRRFLNDHRVLVEPACGASLAYVYRQASELGDVGNVWVIVCGGVGITLEQLARCSAQLGLA
jgi:L-serine/L-threonine ammonia-lyase